jgi:class 3 adenylate cyclase
VQPRDDTGDEQLFIFERMAWGDNAATAAEVTALQLFRDLFSSEALRPGDQINVGQMTILFTDLRGSTRLYREIGDSVAFGTVMNHFDLLRAEIAREGGSIVKTLGDAVMAAFPRLEPLSTGQDCVVTSDVRHDPEVAGMLDDPASEYEAEPLETELKGFDEERFELWRVTEKKK